MKSKTAVLCSFTWADWTPLCAEIQKKDKRQSFNFLLSYTESCIFSWYASYIQKPINVLYILVFISN